MELEFIKEEKYEQDLPVLTENWESSSMREKRERLQRELVRINGFGFHQNMKPFRLLTYPIKASVSLEKVIELGFYIRRKFSLECFQIAIDRSKSKAYMLFAWLREDGSKLVLTAYDWTKLTVCIIRYLNLPRPDLDKSLTRYFLQDAYELDPNSFRRQIEILFNERKVPGLNYTLVHDALMYAEFMCKGQCK